MKLIRSLKLFIALAILILSVACGSNNTQSAITDNNSQDEKLIVEENAAPKFVPGTPIEYDSTKRYIFLTWDDSPQPPGTDICKNIFLKNGVKATFFAIGEHQFDDRRKRIVDSIRNGYPELLLANHSHSHGFNNRYKKFYLSGDSAVQDFILAEQEMNIPVKIIRLPGNCAWAANGKFYGPKSTKNVAKKLDSLGYSVIGWDMEWEMIHGSIPKQSVGEMVKEVNDRFDSGNTYEPNTIVILAHDRMFAKQPHSDSLDAFIAILKQDSRNVFETIDHYPTVQRRTAK